MFVYFVSVGKILFFYIIFYIALSAFFAGLLAVFWQTLDMEKPKWQLGESIIGTNPGLGFRPMPPEAPLGSTLIWYKASRPDNMRFWLETVNKFLDGKYAPFITKKTQLQLYRNQDKKIMLFFHIKCRIPRSTN